MEQGQWCPLVPAGHAWGEWTCAFGADLGLSHASWWLWSCEWEGGGGSGTHEGTRGVFENMFWCVLLRDLLFANLLAFCKLGDRYSVVLSDLLNNCLCPPPAPTTSCAFLRRPPSYFLHPKSRKMDAVLSTLKLLPLPPRHLRCAVSAAGDWGDDRARVRHPRAGHRCQGPCTDPVCPRMGWRAVFGTGGCTARVEWWCPLWGPVGCHPATETRRPLGWPWRAPQTWTAFGRSSQAGHGGPASAVAEH